MPPNRSPPPPTTTCRCSNQTIASVGSNVSLIPSPWINGTYCQEITFTDAPFSSAERKIVTCVDPATFGRECDSHWTRVFRKNSDEDWYDSRWCFVDPDECDSVRTFDANILDRPDLALSYAACGNLGSYDGSSLYEHIRGSTIRIAYPPVKFNGVYYSANQQNRDGVAVRFFQQYFFDLYELNIVETNVSAASLERYSDVALACAHDVAIGVIDLCPIPLRVSPEAALLTRFTYVYAYTNTLLVINSADYDGFTSTDTGFWYWIWTPLSPFSWQTWLAILFASFYMEIAKRVIHKKLEGKQLRNPFKVIGSASFDAIVSTAAGGEVFIPEKTSVGEKIMISGFAIFAWIFMSAYTAAFVFNLLSETEVTSLSSVQILVTKGDKVCSQQVPGNLLLQEFEFLTAEDIIVVDRISDVVDGLNNGTCKGGIIQESAYHRLMAEDSDFCNTKTQIGDPLIEVPMATPTSKKFASVLDYVVLDGIDSGVFDELFDEYLNVFYGPPICEDHQRRLEVTTAHSESRRLKSATASSAASAVGTSSAASELTISHMTLPLLTTLIATTVGLFVFLWSKYRTHVLDNLDRTLLSHEHHSRRRDQEMRDEIARMTSAKVTKILLDRPDRCPQSVVLKAMNNLPDRGPLDNLLFRQEKEDDRFVERFTAFHSLTVAQLYRGLIKGGDREVVNQANEALGSYTPKSALVDVATNQTTFEPPQIEAHRNSSRVHRVPKKEDSNIYAADEALSYSSHKQMPNQTKMSENGAFADD